MQKNHHDTLPKYLLKNMYAAPHNLEVKCKINQMTIDMFVSIWLSKCMARGFPLINVDKAVTGEGIQLFLF